MSRVHQSFFGMLGFADFFFKEKQESVHEKYFQAAVISICRIVFVINWCPFLCVLG